MSFIRVPLALFDEHDALLSTPLPQLDNDLNLEVNTRLAPPGHTSGRLIVTPVTLPLTLWADDHGNLRPRADGEELDDAQLATLLARHYSVTDPLLMRAVGIHSPSDRTCDRALTDRVLRGAVAGHCWVMPVFVR